MRKSFKRLSDVRRAINLIKSNKYDSVVSYVNTGEKHPIRLKRINRNIVTDFFVEYPEPKIGSKTKILKVALLEMEQFIV